MLKQVQKTRIMAGESYEIEGVIAEDYTNENGYTKYGSAEFTLKKGGKGWGFVVVTHELVGTRKIRHFIDIQCFDGAYKEAKKLKLKTGDPIRVFGTGHVKDGDSMRFRSIRVTDPNDNV